MEIFAKHFFDIVTTHNDEICYVKHVLDPPCVFLGVWGGGGGSQGGWGTTYLCSLTASAAQKWSSLSPLRGALPKAIELQEEKSMLQTVGFRTRPTPPLLSSNASLLQPPALSSPSLGLATSIHRPLESDSKQPKSLQGATFLGAPRNDHLRVVQVRAQVVDYWPAGVQMWYLQCSFFATLVLGHVYGA